jgi:neutral ceramidase
MLHVGFGVGDITPEAGMQMPGGFFKREGKGARDKLLAVACVVYDGTTPVALVGIDTLFITKPTVEAARRAIQKATMVPGENVLIGASHTHSGGPIASALGCDEDPAYTDKVAKAVAAAVGDAWNSLHAAEVGIGTGHEGGISFNRRFLMRDGREITHPGKPGTPHHDEIVTPAGPIDPDVGVLAVRTPKGMMKEQKVVGVVVNFACHSTVVGGDQFSPDYAGYLRKHLQAHYGENTPVCFLLGPCGDITQVDNMSTAREFGPEHANMMGMKLAAEAVRTIDRMAWLDEAPTAAAVETVPCAIRPEPDPEAEQPPFGLGSDTSKEQRINEAYAKERKLVAEERAKTPKIPCEVQAIRVGPLGIATNGAEYFCEYGLRIKKASPFKPTWVVSLANEWIGYVPTAQAFVGGGYEPRTARSSKMAPDTGQRLVEGALKALAKLPAKPGK